jgi:hypothetical protein
MELTLGTGSDGTLDNFHPLAPGDVVWITPGEQGLQHTVIALRGRGFNPTNPLIEARLLRASDCERVGYLRFRLGFRPDPQDATLLAVEAVRVIVNNDTDRYQYCTVLDRDATLVVDFNDADGHRAHREMPVHVGGIDPTARPDQREAWLRACTHADASISDTALDATSDVAPDAPPPDAAPDAP